MKKYWSKDEMRLDVIYNHFNEDIFAERARNKSGKNSKIQLGFEPKTF